MAKYLDSRRCYEILEAKEGDSPDAIKVAYRQMVKVWHPDRFPNDTALKAVCEEKTKQFTEAYRTLQSLMRLGEAIGVSGTTSGPANNTRHEETLEPARVGDHWGYVDDNGRLRIQAIYETAGPFSEGLAAVSRDDAYGYIDNYGYVAIPLRFNFAEAFFEGRALAQYLGFGYIDKRGEWIAPPKFQAGSRFQEGFAAVRLNGRWGYIKSSGEWLVFPRFDDAHCFRNGRAYASEGGYTCVVSTNGDIKSDAPPDVRTRLKDIVPPRYR